MKPSRPLVVRSDDVSRRDSRTLLVDVDITRGGLIAEQLNHAGFKTDFAVDWAVAHAALKAHHYNSCVVVADLSKSTQLARLAALRRAALRVWIIVLTDLREDQALVLSHRQGADAVLSTPFALSDLTWRLSAFSLRARPSF